MIRAIDNTSMAQSLFYRYKKWLIALLLICLFGLFAILSIDFYISYSAQSRLYYKIDDLPYQETALVLGTSKYIRKDLNPYYQYRMNAAIELYKKKKVTHFLLSGDNAHRSYNEPWTMKRDLLKIDVPEKDITLDYAGFRTLDSIFRAKEVFEATSITIVSQKFHCERALLLARYSNIDAVCLVVPSSSGFSFFTLRLREILARTKAILDLYIFHVQPKFLGPKEPINNEKTDELNGIEDNNGKEKIDDTETLSSDETHKKSEPI